MVASQITTSLEEQGCLPIWSQQDILTEAWSIQSVSAASLEIDFINDSSMPPSSKAYLPFNTFIVYLIHF
jgi:hypothetical protein